MNDYKIIAFDFLSALEKRVNELMAEGYMPIGGVSETRIGYVQALVKTEKKKSTR